MEVSYSGDCGRQGFVIQCILSCESPDPTLLGGWDNLAREVQCTPTHFPDLRGESAFP